MSGEWEKVPSVFDRYIISIAGYKPALGVPTYVKCLLVMIYIEHCVQFPCQWIRPYAEEQEGNYQYLETSLYKVLRPH